MTPADLTWIDEFAKAVAPHVEVRREDSLLILVPNQAYRLNPTGIELLSRAVAGEKILDILGKNAGAPGAADEVHEFFCDVRALVSGCMREGSGRKAVETVQFKTPFNSLPVLSEFAPTYRCNLKCRFCYAGSPDNDLVPELDTAAACGVLDTIRREAKVPGISFTGGEPTLREDLPEMVAHAVSVGLRVNLITNGTMLDVALVASLKAAGLRSAQVSIEGPDPVTHESLTGIPGSFERTVAGIGRLKSAGIPVHTNTTINALNAGALEGIVSLAASLGLDRLSMNMVIPCGTAAGAGRDLWIRYTDVGPRILDVKRSAASLGLKFFWYAPTPYCIFNPVAEGLGNKGCAACDGLLSVSPDGSVLPCSSVRENVGNLLREPFAEVWQSRRAKWWRSRRAAPKKCLDCRLLDVCTGACPLYWSAMGEAELESACLPSEDDAAAAGADWSFDP